MNNETFININYLNWEKETSEGIVLLDFWAEWCSACISQDKIYEELKKKFGNKIKIGKIHVGDNRFLSDMYGVRNIPYLIILKNGKKITQMPGIMSKEALFNQIEKLIENE